MSDQWISASQWARYGWPVWPLAPGSKAPLFRKCRKQSEDESSVEHAQWCSSTKGHHFRDATVDQRRIDEWWGDRPDANVAVNLTAGPVRNAFVLDVDGPEGVLALRELEFEYGALPETTHVITPSGGHHYWFWAPRPVRQTLKAIGPGLETRIYFITVPMSSRTEGEYHFPSGRYVEPAEAPGWVWKPAWRIPEEHVPSGADATIGEKYVDAAVESARDRLRNMDGGTRHHTVKHEGYGIGRLILPGEFDRVLSVLVDAAVDGGMRPSDARYQLRDLLRRGMRDPKPRD